MIYARIIRNELSRKLGAMVVVFLFILLSALLVAGGSSLIVELNSSLDRLFETAKTPHFVQMHTGELDRQRLDRWAENSNLLEAVQIAEMITIDGSALYLGGADTPEEESVMDISFVVQNSRFDFLLDSENRIAAVAPGEIGLPVYYAVERGLGPGDLVTLKKDGFRREFTVTSLIRDPQMNPAIVHSKRFLVNPSDYAELRGEFTEREYLIEFRLSDPEKIDEFSRLYQESGLPSRGPAVDYQLFKVLNGLSDGIVAAVVIILSLLLMVIAMLCLRFTILATIEEDYREIGVMKAIGMPKRKIRGIYLSKYVVLGGGATLLGYLASRPLSKLLSANMSAYVGEAPTSGVQLLIPLLCAAVILTLVIGAALLVLRRFGRITAVEALHAGARNEEPRSSRLLALKRAKHFNINIYLGIRDALQRFRLFGLLTFVFFFSAAMTLVPVHFLSTIRSPEFITYMGIGRSDIRIDLRQGEDVEERFQEIVRTVSEDKDVSRFSPLVTSHFTLLRENGETETFPVETGDLTKFPLDYLKGRAPIANDEMALSYLYSEEMAKGLGEALTIGANGTTRTVRVVGIYQDITNGGRSAKATFPHNRESVVALTVALDLEPGVSTDAKVHEYSEAFYPARVTGLESYLSQTLGNTIAQLEKVTVGAVLLGVIISMLITTLFLKMLINKDSRRIAIMKSIGFSLDAIRLQYLTTSLVLLLIGIGVGTVFSNTIGQSFVSFLWSFMGAASIEFVIEPLTAYLLMPLLLMASVGLTTLATINGIKDNTVAATIAE